MVTVDPGTSSYAYYLEPRERYHRAFRFDLYYIGDGWETIAYQYFCEMNWLIMD